MPDTPNQPTRQFIVKELVKIKSGTTKKNVPYTIWQVRATNPQGVAIQQNLRTFEELPRNEVITCTVTKFESEQYGTSYTLAQVGRKSTRDEIAELRQRIEVLERAVLHQQQQAPPPQAAPPPTPAAVPPPVPPPSMSPDAPPNSDGDIPF